MVDRATVARTSITAGECRAHTPAQGDGSAQLAQNALEGIANGSFASPPATRPASTCPLTMNSALAHARVSLSPRLGFVDTTMLQHGSDLRIL